MSGARAVWSLAWWGVVLVVGCSRTEPGAPPPAAHDAGGRGGLDAGPRPPPPIPDAGDAGDVPIVPGCAPTPETCNGVDDDCNGLVDDMAPVACVGGGESFCVSGRMSACPVRCEVCPPGETRQCFTTLCTYWGSQSCASDGRSFGRCREGSVPRGCEDVASRSHDSPALEQCCIDQGFCCSDRFDLDGDGNTTESLGTCDTTTCGG